MRLDRDAIEILATLERTPDATLHPGTRVIAEQLVAEGYLGHGPRLRRRSRGLNTYVLTRKGRDAIRGNENG